MWWMGLAEPGGSGAAASPGGVAGVTGQGSGSAGGAGDGGDRGTATGSDAGAPGGGRPPGDVPPPSDASIDVGQEVRGVILTLLPWGLSFLLHTALVLIAIFLVWTTITQPDRGQEVVPLVRLSADPGTPVQMNLSQRERIALRQRRTIETESARPTWLNETPAPPSLAGLADTALSKPDPFGMARDTAATFQTSFMGSGGNARRIVFIIDASGSLIDTFPIVILELKKSILKLSDEQMFTILFAVGTERGSGEAVEVPVPRRGLKPATPAAKRQVIEWIDPDRGNIAPKLVGNPVPAIRAALKYKPDLIYLLSDDLTNRGPYELPQERILSEIRRANTAQTKINTIQFLYPDPLESIPGRQGTLKLIAEQSGGLYKFVSKADLKLE